MKNLVQSFSKQLTEALQIGEKAKLSAHNKPIQNILISGLGGSGIGGTIVAQLISEEAKIPVLVNKEYSLPAFVNENTLFIACSYSGNTEETVEALEQAIAKKAKVVCVTSGGKVADIAKAKNLDIITIPGGMPPRACLGYSLTQLFFVLSFNNIISKRSIAEIAAAATLLEKEEAEIKKQAMITADFLLNKIPVIYTTGANEGVAIRFRQQINENSKMLCWHHVIPEMNHNELVGWTQKNDSLAVIIFRDNDDYERNKTRIEICKGVFKKYTSNILDIYSKGNSRIEKSLYLIHLGDWASCFIADKKNIDATEVKVIDHLKSELSKL